MKSLIICLFGLCILAANSKTITSDWIAKEWQSFKLEYKKSYSQVEDRTRFKIYTDSKDRVDQHNKRFENGEVSFTLGMNSFADFTKEERASLTCFDYSAFNSSSIPADSSFFHETRAEIPKSKDWRTEGAVTDVKDQYHCGSCWAFSATGALEGQYFRKTGKLVSLSEQNLIDCSGRFGNKDCEGGLPTKAFEYVRANDGIETEKSYPYEGFKQACSYDDTKKGASCKGYKLLNDGDENKLMKAIATVGPISVAVRAYLETFVFYRGPHIYDDDQCDVDDKNLNHAVLAVGYGTDENGKDFWILKNSWGKRWGMGGYMKLARNNKNRCGIANWSTYPIV